MRFTVMVICSDKCSVKRDPKARKNFLKQKGFWFYISTHLTSAITPKKKPCYNCKYKSKQVKPKSETSDPMNKNETGETLENFLSNSALILLQTAKIVLKNRLNKKEVRVKALLDRGSQCSYLSRRSQSISWIYLPNLKKTFLFRHSRNKNSLPSKSFGLILKTNWNNLFYWSSLNTIYLSPCQKPIY